MADVDFTNFPVNLSPDASDYLIGGSGDNSSEFLTTLSGLSGVINPVDSVHGRVGVVVGQTGDYADTGITNTSNINGGTVFDALNEINTRLNNTTPIHFALGDETSEITAGTDKAQIIIEEDFDLSFPEVYLNQAPTGSSAEFDINISGSSILSTVISIDSGELTSLTAATQPVVTGSYLPSGERLTVDFDQVGSTFGGVGPKIILRGTRR